MARPKVKPAPASADANYSLAALIREASRCDFFGEKSPLRLNAAAIDEASPLHIAIGDNGAGKSFLVQVLAGFSHHDKCVPLEVSMAYRTRGGVERAFMYGSDQDRSTGLNSIGVVKRAISSMHGWGDKAHVALFDEPDTGLSERLAHPMGEYLARFALAPAPGTRGVLIITHSKALVRGALATMAAAGHKPSVALLGNQFSCLDEFLADSAPASVEEMLQAEEGAHAVWKGIRAMLER